MGYGKWSAYELRFWKKGKMAVKHSSKMIREFHTMYPHAQIWFFHDKHPIKK